LYTAQPPTIPPINTHVTYQVNEDAPDEEEIVKALYQLRRNKSPGASGITVEDLQNWHKNATTPDNPCPHSINVWRSIIELVQLTFSDSHNIPDSFGNGILVLVPKPDKSYRGIALLETIYKLISLIIHRQLQSLFNFMTQYMASVNATRNRYCNHEY
jgi:hypothetical protein